METEILYDDGDPNLHICYSVNRQWAYEQFTAYKNGNEDAYTLLLEALRKYNRLKDYEDFINYAGEHSHPEIYLLAMKDYLLETKKPIQFAYKAMKKQQLSLSDFISFAYNKINFKHYFFESSPKSCVKLSAQYLMVLHLDIISRSIFPLFRLIYQ